MHFLKTADSDDSKSLLYYYTEGSKRKSSSIVWFGKPDLQSVMIKEVDYQFSIKLFPMKALQYFGPKDLRFVDVEKPTITNDEVLLEIRKVGICGTDLHIYNGGMKVPTPLTLGHEFVGEVVEVGRDVKHVAVGDRAVAEHVVGCGACPYCRQGKRNLCVKPTVIGIHEAGALAEFMAVPADLVYKLPQDLNEDDGVLVEPLSIALYAVRKAQVSVGQTVGVVGQGPLGLLVDQVAKANGGTVYGIDIMPARLAYAKSHEFIAAAINPKDGSPLTQFTKQTGLDGMDIVFEVAGQEQTARTTLELARPGGKVVILGVFEHDVTINAMQIVKKELQVFGSWTCIYAFEPTLVLLQSGRIDTAGLITHRYSFDQALKAFDESAQYTDNRIKSVIEF